MSYETKAIASFKTKMNLFLYEQIAYNRPSFGLDDFKKYELTDPVVDEYTTVYWQDLPDFEIRGRKIREIEEGIKRLRLEKKDLIKQCKEFYVKEKFPVVFPRKAFEQLEKVDKCVYCSITTDEIAKLAHHRKLRKKSLRGWTLEIDRLDSNYEYSEKNCVKCCYWCNNAKTDEFTPEEFRAIGAEIREIWSNRLIRKERFGGNGSEMSLVDLKK